jgi:EpsI family protein
VKFLSSKYAKVLTFVLLLQGVGYYALARRAEHVPIVGPLALFPMSFGGWTTLHEFPMEKEVEDVLKADDSLNREYVNPAQRAEAYLFIAFFKTQRYGQSPHSPKNCLPGAGWEQITADRPVVTVPGWPAPIQINRYVVQHGEQKSVTLYWYQSHSRVIASEFSAKFWLVADSIRYHRSDTALVRVVVPVVNDDVERATRTGVAFTKALFPQLLRQLPL